MGGRRVAGEGARQEESRTGETQLCLMQSLFVGSLAIIGVRFRKLTPP